MDENESDVACEVFNLLKRLGSDLQNRAVFGMFLVGLELTFHPSFMIFMENSN